MPGATPTYGWPYPIATDPLDDAVSVIPQALALAMEATLTSWGGIAAPGAWNTIGAAGQPAFTAGFQAFGAPLRLPQYRKIGGEVILRGVVTTPAAKAAGVTVFTLPANFRPTAQEVFEPAAGTQTRIDVLPTGVVQVVPALAAGSYFSLSGIRFYVD